MAHEFKLPDAGEGIHEAELVSWKVAEGDTVEEDQVLAEVETDKAVVEVPSSYSGTVLTLHFEEGDTINVGEVIATIGEEGETADKEDETEEAGEAEAAEDNSDEDETSTEEETGDADATEESSEDESKEKVEEEEPEEKRGSVSVVGTLEEAPDEDEPEETPGKKEKKQKKKEKSSGEEQEKVLATPKVRKLAEENGVDLTQIDGSGKNGRITQADIEEAAETGEAEETEAAEKEGEPDVKHKRKYDMFGHISRVDYSGIRKTIGENMRNSLDTAAHTLATDMVDVTELWEIKDHEKEAVAEQDVNLTLSPFIIKAVETALRKHPRLNAELHEEDNEIIVKEYYNIGFAVDTEHGLLVPVIKGVDQKSILDIAEEAEELADKARNRELDRMDMKGHSFTITNYGSIGGWFGAPVINPGNSAILGIGRVQKLPWVVDDEIQVRRILPLSLNFDHRVTDGAEAARFMNTLKTYLEDPDKLLLEAD